MAVAIMDKRKDSSSHPTGHGQSEQLYWNSAPRLHSLTAKGVCLFFHIEDSFKGQFLLWFSFGQHKRGEQREFRTSFFCHRPLSRQSKFTSACETLVCTPACPVLRLTARRLDPASRTRTRRNKVPSQIREGFCLSKVKICFQVSIAGVVKH